MRDGPHGLSSKARAIPQMARLPGPERPGVGSRVRHAVRGEGTVMEHLEDGRTLVEFDSGESHRYYARSLHKLSGTKTLPALATSGSTASTNASAAAHELDRRPEEVLGSPKLPDSAAMGKLNEELVVELDKVKAELAKLKEAAGQGRVAADAGPSEAAAESAAAASAPSEALSATPSSEAAHGSQGAKRPVQRKKKAPHPSHHHSDAERAEMLKAMRGDGLLQAMEKEAKDAMLQC